MILTPIGIKDHKSGVGFITRKKKCLVPVLMLFLANPVKMVFSVSITLRFCALDGLINIID